MLNIYIYIYKTRVNIKPILLPFILEGMHVHQIQTPIVSKQIIPDKEIQINSLKNLQIQQNNIDFSAFQEP